MVLWSQNHLLVETYMKTFLVFITSNKSNLINREDFQVGKYYLHRKKLDQLLQHLPLDHLHSMDKTFLHKLKQP